MVIAGPNQHIHAYAGILETPHYLGVLRMFQPLQESQVGVLEDSGLPAVCHPGAVDSKKTVGNKILNERPRTHEPNLLLYLLLLVNNVAAHLFTSNSPDTLGNERPGGQSD